MKVNLTRATLLLLLSCSFIIRAEAQESFRKFSIGIGGGIANSYTDRDHSDAGPLLSGTLDYFFTPYLNAGLELQAGRMSGYNDMTPDGTIHGFEAEFATFQARGKVHAGELLPAPSRYRVVHDSFGARLLKGLYLGSGAGIILIRNRGGSKSNYHNKELFLPAMGGVDVFPGEDSRLMLNLNYQVNFVLGDKIDAVATSGTRNDVFSTLSFGLAYRFGRLSYQ